MSPEIISFVTTYGYVAVFLGCLIEGEALVIFASFLAFLGELHLPLVMLLAFAGTFISDLTWFLLGRYSSDRFLHRWSWLRNLSQHSVRLVGIRPRTMAFFMRFMYGFRVEVPFCLGKTRMATSTFVMYNALGVCLWVGIFSGIGFFFAAAAETLFGKMQHVGLFIIVSAILLVIGFSYAQKISTRFIR
jgi:membrane protein DedA with SNARE-associated domain